MSAKSDLQIRFLRIKNYRQYYGEQEIDLSKSNGNINIIQGENGEGKSNILNAINYCLYLEEPHIKEVTPLLPIINLRAIQESPIGSDVDMEIELELGNKDNSHRIKRTVHMKKVELQTDGSEKNNYEVKRERLGTFPVNSATRDTFEIKSVKRGSSGWVINENTESFIHEILPKKLTSFYFLDGEFLESLHTNFKQIKEGIKEISQLSLVLSAIEHTKSLLKQLEIETKGQDPDIDRYQEEVNRCSEWLSSTDGKGDIKYSKDAIWWRKPFDHDESEYYPYSGKPRLDLKKEEEEVLKDRIAEIDRNLLEHNATSIRSWASELVRLEKTIERDESYCDKKSLENMNHIAAIGPEIYLTICVQNFIEQVDEKRVRGELPVKWTDTFVEDILSQNRCICGNDLTDITAKNSLLKWRKKSKESEQLDVAVEAAVNFKNNSKKLKNEFSKIDQFRRDMREYSDNLDQHYAQSKELKRKLKDADEDKIKKLMDEKETRQYQLSYIQRDITRLEDKIEEYGNKFKDAKVQVSRAESKTEFLKRQRSTVSFCRRTLEHLKTIRDNVLTNMRIKVADRTRENFFNLIWKQDEFSNVDLTDDYHLRVIKNGFDAVHTLSAGERLVLALSFIVAIRDITGFRAPLIIDTPLGKISGKPTKNIADFISKFSKDVQVTLLVTDKEYQFMDMEIEQSFRNLIKEYVNREYALNRSPQGNTTITVMK